jgi:hypothetical protein
VGNEHYEYKASLVGEPIWTEDQLMREETMKMHEDIEHAYKKETENKMLK